MAKLNKVSIQSKLDNIKSSKFEKAATAYVKEKFNLVKEEMMEDFINNKVTISLAMEEEGGDAGLLNGKGSLYGFIGFTKGDENPAEELGKYLDKSVKIKDKEKVAGKLAYKFTVSIPSKKDISENTTSPEWLGGGWVNGIEKGISGLESFIYLGGATRWQESIENNSLSRAGLQATNEVRDDEMTPEPYITPILEKFIAKLRSKIKKTI